MIKFFRRIRQKFLEEGRLSKYLIYAIGEILLVVIGILIALQINNWNKKKVTNTYELRLLQGLHSSIENKIEDWSFILNNNHKADSSYQIVKKCLEVLCPNDDQLHRHFALAFAGWYHELNSTAYETAKVYGLNFIQNEQTVNHLSDMYERWQKIYVEVNRDKKGFYNNIAGPYIYDKFERKAREEGHLYIPYDYVSLTRDRKIKSIIEQFQFYRQNIIRWQEQVLEDMHEAMTLLEKEIERYE